MHLFTYGTLMFPAVWQAVVGREFPVQHATLAGYRIARAKGQDFPVMLPAMSSDQVCGLVYFDVDGPALDRLDKFESELYERCAVAPVLAGGQALECQAYVLPERHARYASDEPWTAEWFERQALQRYLQRISR
jgi:gamma-glutamylcyclotransferase (GGCT)/AIG2-like uncharacterized protein YtfP